jgi:hypothetical protein
VSVLVVSLVATADARARQQALDAWLAGPGPDGSSDLRQSAVIAEGPSFALRVPAGLALTRLPTGCVCCVGQVPLRAAIGRIARAMDRGRPRRLLLLLAQGEHLARLRAQIERGELGAGVQLTGAP